MIRELNAVFGRCESVLLQFRSWQNEWTVDSVRALELDEASDEAFVRNSRER